MPSPAAMRLYTQFTQRAGDPEMNRAGRAGISSYDRAVIITNILETVADRANETELAWFERYLTDGGSVIHVDTTIYRIVETADEVEVDGVVDEPVEVEA